MTRIGQLSLILTFAAASLLASNAAAQGIFLTGVGPINRSMSGASSAAPIDAMGALHWNPASISGLDGSELSFGLEMLLATAEVSSSVTNPFPIAGSDEGEPGVSVIPAIGWVHQGEDSPWTVGLGVYGVGGFRTNYPSSTFGGSNNPVLFAQPNGLGRVYAEAEFMQIAPTLSLAVTDRLSVGVAPTITLGRVALDPLLVAPPAGGMFTSGRGTRWAWGGGVQAGVYYLATPNVRLGASSRARNGWRTSASSPRTEPAERESQSTAWTCR